MGLGVGVGVGVVEGGVTPEGDPLPPQERAMIAATVAAPVGKNQLRVVLLYIFTVPSDRTLYRTPPGRPRQVKTA
jgi:hypothetical protein